MAMFDICILVCMNVCLYACMHVCMFVCCQHLLAIHYMSFINMMRELCFAKCLQFTYVWLLDLGPARFAPA